MPLIDPKIETDLLPKSKKKRKRDIEAEPDSGQAKELSKEERRAAKKARKEEKRRVDEARARSKAAKEARTRLIVNGISQKKPPKPRPAKEELEPGRLTPLSDTGNESASRHAVEEEVQETTEEPNGDQPHTKSKGDGRGLQVQELIEAPNHDLQPHAIEPKIASSTLADLEESVLDQADESHTIEAEPDHESELLQRIKKTNDVFTKRVSALHNLQAQAVQKVDNAKKEGKKQKKARKQQAEDQKKVIEAPEKVEELPEPHMNGVHKDRQSLILRMENSKANEISAATDTLTTKEKKRERKRSKRKTKLEARERTKDHTSRPVQATKEKEVGLTAAAPKVPRKVGTDSKQTDASSGTQRMKEKKEDRKTDTDDTYVEHAQLANLEQNTIDSFLSDNHIQIKDPSSMTSKGNRPILDFDYLPDALQSWHLPDTVRSWRFMPEFVGFRSPTPIQAAAWPYLLDQRDLIGIAETGSGKTLAFGYPCVRAVKALQATKKKSRPQAVIVSPTRELASQIHRQLQTLASSYELKTVCIYGGVPKEAQREDLKTAEVVVATPGRLNDLIEEGVAKLSHVRYLVLDEADRMLDKGFEEAIRTIISQCPSPDKGRQTSMFTATWPQSVRDLAATFMKEPVNITIGQDNPEGELRANRNVVQQVEVLDSISKEGRLRELVRQYCASNAHNQKSMRSNRILVFCLYKKEVDRIVNLLRKQLSGAIQKISALHGDMSQPMRTASLQQFTDGSTPILIATDVAARGLDIPDVKVVINFTFPLTAEDYVHRIGRTGRAGKQGLSVTLFTDRDKAQAGALVNVLRAAGQEVPEELMRYDLTVKKKGHEVWGKHYREPREGEKTVGTKTTFD